MRPAFRTTLSLIRASVLVLQLLPPIAFLVALGLLVSRASLPAPVLAVTVGLLVLAAVQLARHWNDTDEWARSGRWIAVVGVGFFASLFGFEHWSTALGTLGFALGCMGGTWVLFTWLRHLCLRSIRGADAADLAASELALTWPLGSGFRLLIGPDEVGVTKRVPMRRLGSEVRWVDRASWPEVGDVAAVTVSEPGTVPNPRVFANETIRVGRLALRMSVGNRVWMRAVRSADRLARVIELRAARHRGARQAGTHEYDRAGPRP